MSDICQLFELQCVILQFNKLRATEKLKLANENAPSIELVKFTMNMTYPLIPLYFSVHVKTHRLNIGRSLGWKRFDSILLHFAFW